MSRISLDELYTLPDLLSQEAFEFLLGVIPLGGETRNLTLKTQSTPIPGMSHEAFEVALHSQVFNFRGRKMYPRTFTTNYVEDVTFDTQKKLRRWMEHLVGTNSSNSQTYKKGYTVHADMVMYDVIGVEINRDTLWYTQVTDVPDANADGSSSTVLMVPATFKYDYFTGTTHPRL